MVLKMTRLAAGRVDAAAASRASSSMCMLHGVTWLQVEAMPTCELGEVLAREADRVQHGAARRAVGAVDDGRRVSPRRGRRVRGDATSSWSGRRHPRLYHPRMRCATVSHPRCDVMTDHHLARSRSRRAMSTAVLDIWLDVACLFKTRSEAQRACRNGKVGRQRRHRQAAPRRQGRRQAARSAGRSAATQTGGGASGLADTHIAKAEARRLYDDQTPPPTPEEVAMRRARARVPRHDGATSSDPTSGSAGCCAAQRRVDWTAIPMRGRLRAPHLLRRWPCGLRPARRRWNLLTDWWWFGEVGQQTTYAHDGHRAGRWPPCIAGGRGCVAHAALACRGADAAGASRRQVSTPEGLTLALPARREVQALGTVAGRWARRCCGALCRRRSWQEVLGWRHGGTFGVGDPDARATTSPSTCSRCRCWNWRGRWPWPLVGLAAAGAGALYLLGGQLAITPFGTAPRTTRAPAPGAAAARRSSCCSPPARGSTVRACSLHADRHHPRRRLHRRPCPSALRAR